MTSMFIREPLRENELLLCIARPSLDDATSEKIRALLGGGDLDWQYVSSAARLHGVTALLNEHVRSLGSDLIPADVLSELRLSHQRHVERCLFLAGQLAKIVAALNERHISSVAFKGPTLAQIAYGDVVLREFADLDILIRERDIARVKETLERQGFRAFSVLSRGHEAALLRFDHAYAFKNDNEVIVDVHWRFAARHFALRIETEELWQRIQPLHVAGQTVMTLSAEDLLVMLCCHGFTHEWERLVWICDVSSLIRSQPLDWDYVLQQATRLGVLRIVLVGLVLAKELGASLPPQIDAALEQDRVVTTIAQRMGSQLFAAQRIQMGLLEWVGCQLAARERMRDKARLLWRFVITPRYYDWMFASVPPSFSPLYYLIRPIRVARNYGRRLLGAPPRHE